MFYTFETRKYGDTDTPYFFAVEAEDKAAALDLIDGLPLQGHYLWTSNGGDWRDVLLEGDKPGGDGIEATVITPKKDEPKEEKTDEAPVSGRGRRGG